MSANLHAYRVDRAAKNPETEVDMLTKVFHHIGVDYDRARVPSSGREVVRIAGTMFTFAADGRLVRVECV